MKKSTTSNGKHKRASKGAGRLYKRDAAGGEHPAEWNGTGAYWLAYSIPNPDGGIGQRVRVPLRDDLGNTITDREQAESKRKQIMAPYQTGDHAETLRALQARIQDAETAHVQAVDEANPPLRIKDAWQAYLQAPERPDSGPLTLAQYEGHWTRFEKWTGMAHPEAEYLRDVTQATAAEYASDLSKAKLSGNRFNKHIGFLLSLIHI